ncbi:MAG: 4-hydroxy-tetrahydrodipicolinate reductase [Prevotellaceae bacterium]|jgi:4-hydroxy-tetrahydrodipicolinate reductase|nr:4-hydroxy-tetrahydrodipicolinate reductase [Prevotellaceae bacterium]
MKIALLGYGKMGKEIEKIAHKRGHEIVIIIDKDNQDDIKSETFLSAQMAIEFTTPETAFDNISTCLLSSVPVVSGTTGWLSRYDEIKALCEKQQCAFFYASNYSLGVNIFFHINRELARIMEHYADYNVSMEEIHHIQKKDSPSGTAISLANDIISLISRKLLWINESNSKDDEIAINSIREGTVPGTHTVVYESEADIISIEHRAKNRKGLALGVIIAAEFLINKKGIYTMDDVLGISNK